MPITAALRRFSLSHPHAFLVPAEQLNENGLEPDFADLLIAEGRLSAPQIECLQRATRLYRQRCRELFARAPASWFPPRAANLLLISEPRSVVPYIEPFVGTSSSLYVSDLNLHPEYVAYLLVHVERLAMLHSVRATLLANLSYWFDRDDASRRDFATAAAQARRPDAGCFIALAKAFSWIDELVHLPLREPKQRLTEPHIAVENADLYIPQRLQPQVTACCEAAESSVYTAMQRSAPAGAQALTSTVDALCDWLQQARAHVVVMAADGTVVWTPDMKNANWIRRALLDAADDAVASVHEDLRIIDQRSRQFLDCVHDTQRLPTQCSVLESTDGVYLDPARRAVVYRLQQPAFDVLKSAAPPYYRLLLGARAMHEWGHLAHSARFLRVPEEHKRKYADARAHLGACFARTLALMPEKVHAVVDQEAIALSPTVAELPAMLARKTLARVGDYLSNLMCSMLIPGEEMQAYVRTNVRHHQDENLGIVSELARYAYEVHYLALADLPRSYFFETSRFVDYYIHSGIVSERTANALFDAAGEVLACYSIDESKITLPQVSPARATTPRGVAAARSQSIN